MARLRTPVGRLRCPPEKRYPGVLGYLLPSGVANTLGAVSALWRPDEFLDSAGRDWAGTQ